MSPLRFAWRSLTRERARLALGAAGVAAVAALLLDMLLLSRGLVLSFGDLLASTGYDVRVTATDALPGLGPPLRDAARTAAAIRALPEVEQASAIRFGRGWAIGGDGERHPLTVLGSELPQRGEWGVLEGEELAGSERDRVLVSRALADAFGLAPGAPLRIVPQAPGGDALLVPVTLAVKGIARFPFDPAGAFTVAVSDETFADLFAAGRDEADLLVVASRRTSGPEAATAAIQRLRPDVHAFSIEQFLDRFRRTDFSYFRQISFVLSTITSFFAFLLVATILTVSVNQRLGEVAALRAIGFSRRRVALDLLAESAILVGTGGLAALPLGLFLAHILDRILRAMPGLPERLHFFVVEPRTVVFHGALLAVSALVASAYPVWLAIRLPIADTLRREVL